jgi:hypothetical protein
MDPAAMAGNNPLETKEFIPFFPLNRSSSGSFQAGLDVLGGVTSYQIFELPTAAAYHCLYYK